jgi:hypothetical protein
MRCPSLRRTRRSPEAPACPFFSRGSRSARFPLALAALLAGCAGSPPKPAEEPRDPVASSADGAAPAPPASPPEGDRAPSGGVDDAKPGRPRDATVPDDYALTAADCDALGAQYGAAMRNDQVVALSPKLSAAQRTQVEANIDKVVTKLATQWSEGCTRGLVGKVVERKVLSCALDAKTVKDFKACIGDDGSTGKR